MNIVVLEYEEKIQRSAAEVIQLQEQLSVQTARADANIEAYRRVSIINYFNYHPLINTTVFSGNYIYKYFIVEKIYTQR